MLQEIPTGDLKDPNYYASWLLVALGQGWDREDMLGTLEKGIELAPEYCKQYQTAARFLWPRWYGNRQKMPKFLIFLGYKPQPSPWKQLIEKVSNNLPGRKGDLLYLHLALVRYSAEAEARYASFAPKGERNPWLQRIYLVHGMKEKYEPHPAAAISPKFSRKMT